MEPNLFYILVFFVGIFLGILANAVGIWAVNHSLDREFSREQVRKSQRSKE